MRRDNNEYLVPLLLAGGSLPLGRLVYHATGEIYPNGQGTREALDDLERLEEEGLVRAEKTHNVRHRRIERIIHLTPHGYEMCEKILDLRQYTEFVNKEAELETPGGTAEETVPAHGKAPGGKR